MADVQTENGFTMIANDLMDAIISTRIPAEVRRVFDYILRMTYGYRRKSFETTHYEIANALKTQRPRVSENLKWLQEHGLVNGTEKRTVLAKAQKTVLSIQKDYDKWSNGTEKRTVKKQGSTVRKSVPSTVRKSVPSPISTIIVKEKRKAKSVFTPPTGESLRGNGHSWIDSKAWDEWVEHLRQKKCKPTALAIKKQLSLLEKFKSQHRDIIDKAITSNWQGLFPPKNIQSSFDEPDAPRGRILEAPVDGN